MFVKVLVMQSGERVIAGISEMTDEEGNGLGFIIRSPYILGMTPSGQISSEGDPSEFQINFTKWFPFSTDIQFKIPYISVTAIGEPHENILNIYLEKFGDTLNDTNDGGDAGDIGTSDSGDSAEEPGVSDSTD